jgi:uncharacterized protein
MEDKKTLVLGASENPDRYANRALKMLQRSGVSAVGVGLRKGKVGNVDIHTGKPELTDIHTVTLYLSKKNQAIYYDYIMSLKPKRIIYNPGAENEVLEAMAEKNGIENVEGCTLVMLATGQF